MAEGVVYEGIGRPKAGPVEWVKQKLAARYTEKGRIKAELAKIEKVMGPLSEEQKQQAAEKMHLEGKIKNKVVFTVVKDAVAGTVVVGTAVYLGVRSDQRAKLFSAFQAGSEMTGNAMVGSFDKALTKLAPKAGENAKFFPGLLTSMIKGAKTLTEKGTKITTGVLERGTASSLKSMSGRVIKAENVARAINIKAGPTSSEAVLKKVDKAFGKVGALEDRYARAQVLTEAIKKAPDAIGGFAGVVKMGVDMAVPEKIDANKAFRPVEKAMIAIRSAFAKNGEKHYAEALTAAQKALADVGAKVGVTPDEIYKASQVVNQAFLNNKAAEILAQEAAEKAARIAADKLAREAVKAVKKVVVSPAKAP